MAAKTKTLLVFFDILLWFTVTESRIHKLTVDGDSRSQIDLMTFGFLKKGFLDVDLSEFHVIDDGSQPEAEANVYGFTLEKTVSPAISTHYGSKQGECAFNESRSSKDDSVAILFFTLDLAKQRISWSHKGDDLRYLNVSIVKETEGARRRKRSVHQLSDSALLGARRTRLARQAGKPPGESTTAPNPTTVPAKTSPATTPSHTTTASPQTPGKDTSTTPKKSTEEAPKDEAKSNTEGSTKKPPSEQAPSSSQPPPDGSSSGNQSSDASTSGSRSLELMLPGEFIPMPASKGKYKTHFRMDMQMDQEEGLYNLIFHNCRMRGVDTGVSFVIRLTENNNGNYLSAGEMPLPMLYFVLCIVHFVVACYWFYILRNSTEGVFKIHYLMLVLVYVKSLALLFHGVNFYFIQKEGRHEEAFAILYYITHLMKGALLFITIVLIGAGWAFVKHILSDRDKKIFIIVIPLQILANVAQIILEETEEGQSQYKTWNEIFILVDLICCGAILFPVVWSMRHLQEASQTDGKAAINLAKLKIFRHFYIMIVCYIYFTRIIVYLLGITVPFRYDWLDELFKEVATLLFFIVTGYKFRPASDNPYLQVSTESDDEIEMDEVVTEIGAYENITKVNVRSASDESRCEKRESSHDYD